MGPTTIDPRWLIFIGGLLIGLWLGMAIGPAGVGEGHVAVLPVPCTEGAP